MAKHGMEGRDKTGALEAGAQGVTINTFPPAYVRTNLLEKQINYQAHVFKLTGDQVINEIMLAPAAIKRLIELQEIANMALYLSGPNSNSISGTPIVIDNGRTAR